MSQNKLVEYIDVYNQAIKYLGLRAHTEFELRNKLIKKKFPRDFIDQALGELKLHKYLDDESFALMFAQNLIRYKTFGYYGIKMKLKQRGISDSMSEQILSDELTLDEETKIAQKILSKKNYDDRQKAAAALQRKGFRSQVIAEVVN